jgi:hypothetical protein
LLNVREASLAAVTIRGSTERWRSSPTYASGANGQKVSGGLSRRLRYLARVFLGD